MSNPELEPVFTKQTTLAGIEPEISFKNIWRTLSAHDCSEHIQKIKAGSVELSYLSWAWAWGILMEYYPEAEFSFNENEAILDDTVSVNCQIVIGNCKREMWLPVMDNRNNAIVGPNARDISDAKMRCLVKNLALFGLGHHIYAGQDLPTSKPEEEVQTNAHLDNLPDKEKPKYSTSEAAWKNPGSEEEEATLPIHHQAPHPIGEVKNWATEEAAKIVDQMIKLIKETTTDIDGMKSFITNNTGMLDDIKKHHKDEAERFRAALKEIKDNF